MKPFWRQREEQADWPEPRTEFLNSLADNVREARSRPSRFRELRLALVMAVVVALLVPLAAFAGRGPATGARDTVKAVFSIVSEKSTPSRDAGRGGHDDDDDDNGGHGYYDDECDDFGKRRSALARHQKAEREALRRHQSRSNHPGLSSRQRARHYKQERIALFFHQQQERKQLKKDCPPPRGHDDDDDDRGDDDDDDD
jgi:hypothetical protein